MKGQRKLQVRITLSSHLGYDRVRQVLYELFGRKYLVACILIMELPDHKPVEYSADDLTNFAIRLHNKYV